MQSKVIKDHQQHKSWLSQLDFYEEEIEVFFKEITIIMNAYADSFSVIEHAEEYQDIFSKKNTHIQELKIEIRELEKETAINISENRRPPEGHRKILTTMTAFVTEMEELKINFRRFTAKHLH